MNFDDFMQTLYFLTEQLQDRGGGGSAIKFGKKGDKPRILMDFVNHPRRL